MDGGGSVSPRRGRLEWIALACCHLGQIGLRVYLFAGLHIPGLKKNGISRSKGIPDKRSSLFSVLFLFIPETDGKKQYMIADRTEFILSIFNLKVAFG